MVDSNPTLLAKGALGKKPKGGHRAAIIELEPVREMLVRAEAQATFPQVKLANRMMALTALRPGGLRFARWAEFKDLDTDAPYWLSQRIA